MMYDLLIIGAGPGGYEVAIEAGHKGLQVLLIDKGEVGGTCLNEGCIPTKVLYHQAKKLKELNELDTFGIHVENISFDFSKMQRRKDEVKESLKKGIVQSLAAAGVTFIQGEAKFVGNRVVQVGDETYEAKHVLIATGSKNKTLDVPGIDGEGVLTSKEMLDLVELPETLTVIGGGVIGVEMASIFNALGTKVKIVEYEKQLLSFFDEDLSKRLKTYLKKEGIEVYTDHGVREIDENRNVHATSKGKEVTFTQDLVLIATGRAPYMDQLQLDTAGIAYDRFGIKVNESYETSVKNVYAVGDCIGGMMLAHTATYQSFEVLKHILKEETHTNHAYTPAAVFVYPEIATVGLTEKQAKETCEQVNVSKYLFRANGKALAMGETDGFVKVISSEGKLVGCHIIGPHASDLIHEATVLMNAGVFLSDVTEIIHAHPTISETLSMAIRQLKQ